MKTIHSILIITSGFFLLACGQQEDSSMQKSESSETKDTVKDESSLDGQLMEIAAESELALEMRAIEKELKRLKGEINKEHPQISWTFVPENFLDAEATDPNVKNGDFESYTRGFHQSGLTFESDPSEANYEMIINACISCHEQFCTGPIKRIEKLHL